METLDKVGNINSIDVYLKFKSGANVFTGVVYRYDDLEPHVDRIRSIGSGFLGEHNLTDANVEYKVYAVVVVRGAHIGTTYRRDWCDTKNDYVWNKF